MMDYPFSVLFVSKAMRINGILGKIFWGSIILGNR